MRIACVDQSAAERVALQKLFEDTYEQCRGSVGHLSLAQTYPATKEEVIVNAAPDVIAVGPASPLETVYGVCRDLRAAHPTVPLVLFLSPERYSLRTLRRFEKVSTEIFSTADAPIRIIHKLSSFESSCSKKNGGTLVTISGVKGGVGATSIVAGLAHAAQAIGKRAVVLDLSPNGVFAHYMSAPRWQSPDFTAMLLDGITPEQASVERCLSTAPNGIAMLLPPSGGSEVRELWLRSSSHFEITLSVVEVLTELFDLVLVDLGGAEGILQFGLQCRAGARLLVTSNDPASVHLLSGVLTQLTETPGDGEVRVLINNLIEGGLSRDDILDFLYFNRNFEESMASLESLPFDRGARNWIGSGNSFYTEGSRAIQRILESNLHTILLRSGELRSPRRLQSGFLEIIRRLTKNTRLRKRVEESRPALPLLRPFDAGGNTSSVLHPADSKRGIFADQGKPDSVQRWSLGEQSGSGGIDDCENEQSSISAETAQKDEEHGEDKCLYHPPRLLVNE